MLCRDNVLTSILVSPEISRSLDIGGWNQLIPAARREGLLGRLAALLDESMQSGEIPPGVQRHLESAALMADNEQRVMLWELKRIERGLDGINSPIILLKGAAYVATGLPVARGRLSTDIDLLVSKDWLNDVEEKLLAGGWEHIKLEPYDQLFYRRWSHELPPLRHRNRATIVDVHHTILPPTGRLKPNPEKLIKASVSLDGTIFRVLAPVDMVLHSAAHGFQDGDLARGLRDLVDIDNLLRHFERNNNFWNELLARCEELNLQRPVYYALTYAHRCLQTPIPDQTFAYLKRWKPLWPAAPIMDAAVNNVITGIRGCQTFSFRASRQLLYIRSHYLRMPIHKLLPHLARKWLVNHCISL